MKAYHRLSSGHFLPVEPPEARASRYLAIGTATFAGFVAGVTAALCAVLWGI